MIRTNLSTRPFYNTRVVHGLLVAFAVVVLAATAYNVAQLVWLTTTQRTLGAKADAAETEAMRLRQQATQVMSRIDQKELAAVDKAAREANAIIDGRTFSWTQVFAHFERTLPPNVRITSVQQQTGRQVVVIGAEARDIDDVAAFIEALEKTGAFRDVTPRNETMMENDIISATLEATYVPTQPEAAGGAQ